MSNTLSSTIRAPVFNKYVCGVKGTARKGRVVGGEDGEEGEWCWQAALINSLNQYVCGAALIGTQWVLTAAHCITKYAYTNYLLLSNYNTILSVLFVQETLFTSELVI